MTTNNIFKPHHDTADMLGSLVPATTASYKQMQRELARVRVLKKIMPALTVLILICLIFWPILNNKEGSFTLAIDRLDQQDGNAKLTQPRYVGIDKYNHTVNISAQTAFRKNNDDKDYYLKNLRANMMMRDGTPIEVRAVSGMLNANAQEIILDGTVNIITKHNFTITTEQALFQINDKIATGKNGISGTASFGTFKADTFHIDVDQEIIKLKGHVKLHFDPDKQIDLSESIMINHHIS